MGQPLIVNLTGNMLDQDVVNLAKAIRQHETGNRPIAGATGETASRYQFLPSTWKSDATRILGDANAPINLENENKVAYTKIKEWKDKGYNPGQIASMWNSGNPDMYAKGNKGVGQSSANSNVTFNVPKYVQGVYSNYQKLKQENPPQVQTEQPVEQKPGILSRIGSFLTKDLFGGGVNGDTNLAGDIFRSTVGSQGLAGVAQMPGKVLALPGQAQASTQLSETAGSTADQATGLLQAARNEQDPTRKQLMIDQAKKLFAQSQQTSQQRDEINQNVLTPQQTLSTAANAGLTALSGEGKLVTGATEAVTKKLPVEFLAKNPNLLQGIEKTLQFGKGVVPRAVEQAGISGGFTASQNLRNDKPLTQGLAPSLLLGAALPVAGLGASKLASGVGKLGTEILGKTTGSGSQAIKEAFSNPKVMEFARKAGKDGPEQVLDDALNSSKNGLQRLKQSRGAEYTKQLEAIKLDKKDLSEIGDSVRGKLKQLLTDRKISVVPQVDEVGNKLNKFDFSKSTIVGNEPLVEKALNEVLSHTDNTAAGFDTLKRRIGEYIDQIPDKKGPAKTMLIDLQQSISSQLKSKVKGYEAMQKGYSQASDLISEIEKAFSLGNTKQKETALRKLMQTVRRGDDSRKALLEELKQVTGQDIGAMISGALLGPKMPRGLTGAITPTLAGASIALHPASLVSMLPFVWAFSPRLAGEFSSLMGKITSKMQTENKLSPLLERAFRTILFKTFSSLQENKEPTNQETKKLEEVPNKSTQQGIGLG